MQRVAIRRLGLWSVFRFSIVAYLILFAVGFVMLLAGYVIALFGGAITPQQETQALQQFGLSGAIALLIVFFGGLFGALFYAVLTWLAAVVFNALSSITGGIDVFVEKE